MPACRQSWLPRRSFCVATGNHVTEHASIIIRPVIRFVSSTWNAPRFALLIIFLSLAVARFQTTLQNLDEARWHSAIWYDASGNAQPQHHQHTTIVHHHHIAPTTGKPLALLMMEDENILLDPDSLATLLLFLFVEDQKVNSVRLHRVIRNLCHHEPTRDWIIRALISIIQKTNEDNSNFGASSTGSKPEWLKLRVDAAFGYKSNIFLINQTYEGKARSISINPQAAQMIVRNCLDLLFVLAKHYPFSFLPYNREPKARSRMLSAVFGMANASGGGISAVELGTGSGAAGGQGDLRSRYHRYQMANRLRGILDEQEMHHQQQQQRQQQPLQLPKAQPLDEAPSTSKAAAAKAAASASTAKPMVAYQTNSHNFWDVVLDIDRQTPLRLANVAQFPLTSQTAWKWQQNNNEFLSFSESPFGQLLEMLPYKVICRSPHLTDMLVKLLASLSVDLPKEEELPLIPTPQQTQPPANVEQQQQQHQQQLPPLVPINQQYPPAEPANAAAAAAAGAAGAGTAVAPAAAAVATVAPTVGAPVPAVPANIDNLTTEQPQTPIPTMKDDEDEDDDDEDEDEEDEEEDEDDEDDDDDEDLEYELNTAVPTPPPPPPPPPTHALSNKPRRKIYAKNFSQLQLVIEVLTHQCGTTEGLDNVTKLIVNLTQCSQASNAIFIQYLTAAILGLAEEVRQAIQTLLNEIHAYNLHGQQQPAAVDSKPSGSSASPVASTSAGSAVASGSSSSSAGIGGGASLISHLTVHEGQMQDRFTAESVIISAPKNAKPTCELQLPSMKKLMSNSSAQPYFLRTLKIFMQVRDMYEIQISQNEDNNDDIIDIVGDAATAAAASSLAGDGNGSNSMETGDAATNVNSAVTKSPSKPTLSQILCLDVLWHTLSECLVALEESKDEFAVLVLQPTVEAFFLIHASHRVTPKKPGRGSSAAGGGTGRGTGLQATSSEEHSPQLDDTNSSTSSQAPNSNCFDGNYQTCEHAEPSLHLKLSAPLYR